MKSGGGGGGGGGGSGGGGGGAGGKTSKGKDGGSSENREKEMEELRKREQKLSLERTIMMQMVIMCTIPIAMVIGLIYCLYLLFDGFYSLNKDDRFYDVKTWNYF